MVVDSLTHWERLWCWERLKPGGKGDGRRWDAWMASPTRSTRVWVSSRSWRWTGKPGVLQSMGSQRDGHDWATEQTVAVGLPWQLSWWRILLQRKRSQFDPWVGKIPGEETGYPFQYSWASLVAQMKKNLPTMQETWVWFLGWEDSPGGRHGNTLQYSCLENPHGQRSLMGNSSWGHKESDTTEQLSTHMVVLSIVAPLVLGLFWKKEQRFTPVTDAKGYVENIHALEQNPSENKLLFMPGFNFLVSMFSLKSRFLFSWFCACGLSSLGPNQSFFCVFSDSGRTQSSLFSSLL